MFDRLVSRLARSVLFWDLVLTLLALQLASTIRLRFELGNELPNTSVQLPWQLYAAVCAIWFVVFMLLVPQRAIFTDGLMAAIGRLVAAVSLSSMSFAGLLYLSVRNVSRLQFIYFALLNLVLLLCFHLIVRAYILLRHRRSVERRVLIVGGGEHAAQLAQEFMRRPWAGVDLVGYTGDEPNDERFSEHLGAVQDTEEIVAKNAIDEVIFALPSQRHDEIAAISLRLSQYPVMIHMVPGVLDLAFARTTVESLGGVPLISLRESALTEAQRLLKRVFDVGASAALLVLLSPVLALIAIAIKLESPGPVFFRQVRIGEHGRRFKMIKFRSMYRDAEQRWQEVARRDADGRLLHKHENDPRITRIGAKLRRTSLDELPQLINVLLGEMSLVGPRPEMPYIAMEYEPWQWQRFRVQPGMTGWWQVNGRGTNLMHLHTEDDLYYIQNYSFWLDLRILWRTLGAVLRREGAY